MYERVITPITDRASWLERRKRNCNASDMAALFECHPYKTALELYAEKRGEIPPVQIDNAAMRRGLIFEAAVAADLRDLHPDWKIEPYGQYCTVPAYRIGATPDFIADNGVHAQMLVQVKTVTPDKWEADWTPTPPAHFLIQVQTEMLCAGLGHCLLAVMVMTDPDYPVYEYEYDADPAFQAKILARAKAFWKGVADGVEPRHKPAQDRDTLQRMHPNAEKEPVLSLHGREDVQRVCEEYLKAHDAEKAAKASKDAAAGRLAALMRNHARAEAQDFIVSWPTIPEAHIAATVRKPYRRMTVTRRRSQV